MRGAAAPEVGAAAGDHTYHLDEHKAQGEVEREVVEVPEELEEQTAAGAAAAAAVVPVEDPTPPVVLDLVSFPQYPEEEEEEAEAQGPAGPETRGAAAAAAEGEEAVVEGTREEVGTRAAAETEVGEVVTVEEEEAAGATVEAAAAETGEAMTVETRTAAGVAGTAGEVAAVAAGTGEAGEVAAGTGEAVATARTGEETAAEAGETASQDHVPWVGVGTHSWNSIMGGRRMEKRPGKRKRRIWLFGDSILRGVGERIDFHTAGYYEIVDRTQGGASILKIRDIVRWNLTRMKPEDMVVVEGGGNGLEVIGERETHRVLKEIVEMLKAKVGNKVLVMCVPRRQAWEGTVNDRKRRWLNAQCLASLEEWGCDGLRLLEEMSWREVWARDGVHLSRIGKAWAGWSIVEWARQRGWRRE